MPTEQPQTKNGPSVNSVDPSPLLSASSTSHSQTVSGVSGIQTPGTPAGLFRPAKNGDPEYAKDDQSYIKKDGAKASNGSHRNSSMSFDVQDASARKKPSHKSTKASKGDFRKEQVKFRVFLVIGFLTTTILGVDVATNRYIQNNTGMDGIMLITLRSAIAFVVWLPFTKQFAREVFCMKYFLWFAVLHTLNPVLNTYATKYTIAYYVQAIKLSSPFWVALMCYFLKDKIPKYTIPAMIISTIGAFLTVTGDALDKGEIDISTSDLIGMALALSAAICFSMNFVLYTKIKGTVPSLGLTFLENFLQFVVIGSISFGVDKEDWINIWGRMTSEDIGILCLAMVDSVLGSFGKIASVRVIGAPLFSTMAPWELVVTLVLSASPFLGDEVGILNIVGVVIITITMTIYLYIKYRSNEIEGPKEVPDELGFASGDGQSDADMDMGVERERMSFLSPRVIAVDA